MDNSVIKARLDRLLADDKRSELRGALTMLNPVDTAEYLSELETREMLRVFRILPKDLSSEVFSYMEDDQRQKLLESIGDKEICALVDDMFIDDAVDFLEEMPPELVKRVLANVPEDTRKTINRFLSYPEGSAGSIMTIEACVLPEESTVKQAIDEIRSNGVDKETINTIYVTDRNDRLTGELPLRKLIIANYDSALTDIIDRNFVAVGTLDDQEEVAQTVRKYDLMAVPVIDKEGRPVGIITADDIMDVLQDEATEDMEKMSALTPSEETYMKTGVVKLVLNRLPWLVIMLMCSILTGLIINHFEGLIDPAVVGSIGIALTACIPMLMDTGGNCGQQASTLVIRAMGVGELAPSDALKVLWKEIRVAVIVSVILAAACCCIQRFLFVNSWAVSLTISCAMVLTVLLAKALGALLPLAASALKLDPALTAAPLITTLSDTCSLLILFETAKVLLKL